MRDSTETWADKLFALPLQDAARAAGISVATAKRVIAARPALVVYRRASQAGGRPSPHVLPDALRDAAFGPRSKASARFAHNCRLAGVSPERTLWRIVAGCLPDADKLHDAMRLALDAGSGRSTINGKPAFLAWVGKGEPISTSARASFEGWLARRILAKSGSVRAPRGDIEELWRKAIAKAEREARFFRGRPVLEELQGGKARLALVPDYLDKRQGAPAAPIFAGEGERVRAREGGKPSHHAARALAEVVFRAEGGEQAGLASALGRAFRAMRKAKPAPRFPTFSQAPGRGLEDPGAGLREGAGSSRESEDADVEEKQKQAEALEALISGGMPYDEAQEELADFIRRTEDSAREGTEIDFAGWSGDAASLGEDTHAAEALAELRALGVPRAQARAFLRAYWQRTSNPLGSGLSASAVRQIFGMSTRARTGQRPERRRKS